MKKMLDAGFCTLLMVPLLSYANGCDALAANLTVNADGTISDARTGRSWQACSVGQTVSGTECVGEADLVSFDQVVLTAGYRLPTVSELVSITELDCGEPAVPKQWTGIESGFYWASDEAFGGFRMTVLMTNGEEYPMSPDIEARVILVK